jgi:hypothetical protein
MPERLFAALRRHPGRWFTTLLVGFAALAVCDAYYAFAAHPFAPGLASFVDLTGPRGLPALADLGLIVLAGLAILHSLRGLPGSHDDTGRTVTVVGLAALLIALGAFDMSRLKPSFAGDVVLLAPVVGALVFGMLRGIGRPIAARIYTATGLLLLATNPLTDRLEAGLLGNSDYYSFDAAGRTYVYDQHAWRMLWAVSRAQELSELIALACLLTALVYVAAAPVSPLGKSPERTQRVPSAERAAESAGTRQQ